MHRRIVDHDDHRRTHLGVMRFVVPEDLRHLDVDALMWDSIQHFVFMGLHPGSYGEALLLEDYELACRRGHALHGIWRKEGLDVTANFIKLVQWLPDVCHGSMSKIQAWQAEGGLEGQPSMRVLFKLSL